MIKQWMRRIVCVGALLAFGLATAPQIQAENTIVGSNGVVAGAVTGGGWTAMLGCASCVIGAGLLIVGGVPAIILALNTPGSSMAALACVSACYEALNK